MLTLNYKPLIVFLIILFLVNRANGQGLDLSEIFHLKGKNIRLGGGMSATTTFNQSNDPHIMRQPFTYMIQGNLNLQFMSFNVPINFTFSNQKLTYGYSNPFKINRTAIHPKYKWVTLHLGDINMSLTPFTMSGLMFTGVGVDLAPTKKKIKLSMFYGRFLKANIQDSLSAPTYERWGWGFKADYTLKKHTLTVASFHARDLYNHSNKAYEEHNILPQENICFTFASQSVISRFVDVGLEYSNSLVTRDTRSKMEEGIQHPLAIFIQNNITTSSFTAFKTNINIHNGKRKVTIGFEHIDPNYKSLGALYFNNDFENLTLGITEGFFKKRLTVNVVGGLQRDNLNDSKLRSSQRFVGSATCNLIPNKKMNVTGAYSSFQTYSAMKSQFDRINQPNMPIVIDTLTYMQLSNNATLSISYKLGKSKKRANNLTMTASWQKATEREDGIIKQNRGTQLLNSNISYSLQLVNKGLTVTGSLNNTIVNTNARHTLALGPVLAISHKHKKSGLSNQLSIIANEGLTAGVVSSKNFAARLGSTVTYKKKHNFGLSASWQYRKLASTNGDIRTKTLLGTLNYSYQF
jgi:hypothetical protein